MKVLIAAGGTGGHIYPGIAVAKRYSGDSLNRKFCLSERHVASRRGSCRTMDFSFR